MAPRNNDMNPNFSKKVEDKDSEMEIKDIVPSLLHKKHKVVKIVKSQLLRLQEDGIFCDLLESEMLPPDNHDKNRAEELMHDQNPESSKQIYSAERINDSKQAVAFKRSLGEKDSEREWVEIEPNDREPSNGTKNRLTSFCKYLLIILLALFIVALFVVWVSAGPLSNSKPHTPIGCSLIRTDSMCCLEKRYLLRWSQSVHLE